MEHDGQLMRGLPKGRCLLFVPGCWPLGRRLIISANLFHAQYLQESSALKYEEPLNLQRLLLVVICYSGAKIVYVWFLGLREVLGEPLFVDALWRELPSVNPGVLFRPALGGWWSRLLPQV